MVTMRGLIEGLRGILGEARTRKETPSARRGASIYGGAKSHFKGKPVFTQAGQGHKGSTRQVKKAGGIGHMDGPSGEVEGRWVTVRGKRLFFPDNPGGDVPEGPWGGAPWRPGWTRKGGKFRPAERGRGNKQQLKLKGFEARSHAGRSLSEQLAGLLVEYRTPGWSTAPTNKKRTKWNVKPPGRKGAWRKLGGKNVFFADGEREPWGGAPFRPGWTRRTGKFRPTAKKGAVRPVKKKAARRRGKR
jgi:hypothetical protein